jgi:hypothetical protein
MMREVVGAIMAAFVGVVILWFLLPALTIVKNNIFAHLDTSDPTVQTLIQLGDAVYLIMGFVIFLVIGFVIFSYATRGSPYDVGV